MAERRILFGDIFPQAPASAGSDLRVSVGRVVLIPVYGTFRTASVCHEYQVVLREHDALFYPLYPALNGLCNLFTVLLLKDHIGYFRMELEINARFLQIPLHGQNQGFILIILCKFQRAEIRQSRNMMDKSLEIQFHFQRAVPVFKCKHGPPVQPKSGTKHFLVKNVLDGFIVKILVPGHKQFHDLHTALPAQIEFAVRMGVLPLLFCCPAQGKIGILFVQPIILIQHRYSRRFQGRNAAEQIPQAFKMILHLAPAPHNVAPGGIINSVAGASRYIHGLQNMDMGARHLSVPYQKTCCRQGCQTASYQIRIFFFHSLRLFRSRKGLIIAVCVINPFAVLFVPANFRIAVRIISRIFFHGFLLRFLAVLCRHGCRSRACCQHCHSESHVLFVCHNSPHFCAAFV